MYSPRLRGADWAIHDSENDKGQRNLHIHVLLTMRPIRENGEWGAKSKKVFELDENGKRIPVIDKKTGQQKVDRRNSKQWKCHTEDSTDWNSKENAKMWRKDLADTIKENRIYDMTSDRNMENLEVALLFYSYLNDKDDAFLQKHNFCRAEIKSGVKELVFRYGLMGMAEVFLSE